MKYGISSTFMQTVSIDLERGEKICAQTQAMAWAAGMGGVDRARRWRRAQ